MKTKSMYLTRCVFLLASTGLSSLAFASDPAIYEPSLVPSNPQVGECYARVLIPAQFSTSSETVLTEEAYSTIEVDQARLEQRTEQVETKQAHIRFEVRQPSFRSVTEKKLVRPSYEKLSVVPPKFQTVTETIRTSAPRRVWKLGNPGALAAQGYRVLSTADAGAGGRGYRSTVQYGTTRQAGATHCGAGCEIWCLVEEPGESMSFDRKVMTSPGTVRRTPIAAKYTSVTKQIVADPGGVREIPVPAQYRNIAVEYLANPGGERLVNVPAKYGSVQKKTLTAGQRYEWRRVVCDPAKGRASSYSNGRSSTPNAYVAPAYSGQSYIGNHTSSPTRTGISTGTVNSSRAYGSSSAYEAGRANSYSSSSHSQGSTSSQGSTYSQGTSSYSSPIYGSGTTQSQSTHSTTSSAPIKTGIYYYGTDKPVQ